MNKPTYVVGIGASAGGLEALERFFDNVPVDTGMAFVVIQHLSPDFKSVMDELLARHTELPITLVEDGMSVEANHVYLIPPRKEMIVSGGRLLLSERDRQHELALPIDVFFRSLAQDFRSRAIAIVLSGGGSDGSRGVRDVHAAGGLVIVQNTESAQFDGMPRTAQDVGVAKWVVAPEQMPQVIIEHARNAATRPAGDVVPVQTEGLDSVYRMLEAEFGIDFTHYKPSTVTRRIERRLRLSRVQDIAQYVERLKSARDELDVLYRDLLIGVTRFFRNEEAFAALEHVLPEMMAAGTPGVPFRVWIAGCATGEEVYSLAIVLHEAAMLAGNRPLKIFATDVHRGSLDVAARGCYDAEAVANVPPERLSRYFINRGRTYEVIPELRQLVVFAQHNVIKDPPFTRVDLISCRNMLIYLQPPAQQKVLTLFHFALNRGGIAFLGPSESPGPLIKDFETIDAHWRLYRKFSDVRIPVDSRVHVPRAMDAHLLPSSGQPPLARYSTAQLLGTYDALLEQRMPPSMLVTDRGELVHVFAGASRFLKPKDGRQGTDVFDAVEPELKLVLVGGMKRALNEKSQIVFKGVRLHVAGKETLHKVTLERVQSRNAGLPHVLVSFEAIDGSGEKSPAHETEVDLGEVSRAEVANLQGELAYTKENLQAAIEELETGNEELQAANEELLSSNEELQSTNEELQSVNEELYTVNAEYQRKIGELTELTNDMDNLLASTDIGTIFLDAKLRIRKFTPAIAASFNLMPHDIGRPIETFGNTLQHPGLNDDLKSVLTTGKPIEREVQDRKRTYFLRILPYRAKGEVDGVVVTLIDMSSLKAAEDALFHERYLLNSLLSGVPDAIYFKDASGRFIRANEAMARRFGLESPNAIEGRTPFELPQRDAAQMMHAKDEIVLQTGEPEHYRMETRSHDDGDAWDLATRLPLMNRTHERVGIITIYRDITEQKRAEEGFREAVRRRDEFLAMLSHELRNPLGAVVMASALLRDKKGPGNETARERLMEIIDRQSQQMARLLDDLLEVSRVMRNRIELRKERIDLEKVTREAADAVRALIEARGVSLSLDIEGGQTFIEGDSARIQQVQVNLLSNAAKYTPRGGHVQLRVHHDGDEAVIRVIDDGAGIAKEMLHQVFDLFVQSQRTLDRADGGLGIGLTLVRSLVEMHGGTVVAESEGIGKGSVFTVRLPLAPVEHDAPLLAIARMRRVLPGTKIVIVEDNIDCREMLCEYLRDAGYECHTAEGGESGLALIERTKPDAAIIDLGLPEIDGFELARRLRKEPDHASLFLIALTGYGQSADHDKALAAGFDEHLVKPVEPPELLRVLGEPRDRREVDGLPPRTFTAS